MAGPQVRLSPGEKIFFVVSCVGMVVLLLLGFLFWSEYLWIRLAFMPFTIGMLVLLNRISRRAGR
jgi:hypothetical protein